MVYKLLVHVIHIVSVLFARYRLLRFRSFLHTLGKLFRLGMKRSKKKCQNLTHRSYLSARFIFHENKTEINTNGLDWVCPIPGTPPTIPHTGVVETTTGVHTIWFFAGLFLPYNQDNFIEKAEKGILVSFSITFHKGFGKSSSNH